MTTTARPTVTTTRAAGSRKRITRRVPEIETRLAAAAALQAKIQELEAELKTHREFFLDHMNSTGETTLTLGSFNVYRRSRAKWSYSPALHNEMLRIQNMQKMEQMLDKHGNSIATNNPTVYVALTFKGSAA